MTIEASCLLTAILLVFTLSNAQAQDDLLALAEAADSAETGFVTGTFKATRLVNGHTVETNGEKELLFLISHRFGPLNSGAYNFFGLDQDYPPCPGIWPDRQADPWVWAQLA